MKEFVFPIIVAILAVVIMVLVFRSYMSDHPLEEIKNRMRKLSNHIHEMEGSDPIDAYLKDLDRKFNSIVWKRDHKSDASYTTNKKVITLCFHSKNTGNPHSMNLMTYVSLHELAHVACPEEGHTQLFKDIFQKLVQVAVDAGIYQLEDYHSSPVEYCGMVLSDCDRCLFNTKRVSDARPV